MTSMTFKSIKSVTVDCNTWLRGLVDGIILRKSKNPMLLNPDGNRCCLGFECKARGIKDGALLNNGGPSGISCDTKQAIPKMTKMTPSGCFANESFITKAMTVNDDIYISDFERMEKLKKIFKLRGIALKFRNVKQIKSINTPHHKMI